MTTFDDIGAIVIGRNEGDRLITCIQSLLLQLKTVIYVDSGSTDDSVDKATALGATVVALDPDTPFTAARARNAGLDALLDAGDFAFVQFVDGDCEVEPAWITAARAFLDAHPAAVVVCGRRKERYPDATIYNRLIDAEWDTPIGKARACGGDALMRVTSLREVGGFNPNLIAGEEPELCVRLRAAGGEIYRIAHPMTIHDAALKRFGQWWRRNRRAGHAYAEGAALHGAPPEQHNVTETRRAVAWGVVLPILSLIAVLLGGWALLLLVIWPLQVTRLNMRGMDWTRAFFLTLGKIPEGLGVLDYLWRRIRGRQPELIEYK